MFDRVGVGFVTILGSKIRSRRTSESPETAATDVIDDLEK